MFRVWSCSGLGFFGLEGAPRKKRMPKSILGSRFRALGFRGLGFRIYGLGI